MLGSALFSALAICVNGALTVPVVGIVGLFVAGMIRQQKAKAYYLDKALEEATAENTEEDGMISEEEQGKEKVAAVLREYTLKNNVAILYGAILLVGTCLLLLLSSLPMYYTYVKAFDTPASPKMSILSYIWYAFAGGFTATNVTAVSGQILGFIRFLQARRHVCGYGDGISSERICSACGNFRIGILARMPDSQFQK